MWLIKTLSNPAFGGFKLIFVQCKSGNNLSIDSFISNEFALMSAEGRFVTITKTNYL